MTAMKPVHQNVLATAAFACAAAIAFAPPSSADPVREPLSIEFRYQRDRSAVENYASFHRRAERACITPGVRPVDQIAREKACVAELMDNFIATMARGDLAVVHFDRTGRRVDSSRSLAAR